MTIVDAPGLRPVRWVDGKLAMLDQTRLPGEEVWLELVDYRDVVQAIQAMRVRGAPAIGVAGAYAVALAAKELLEGDSAAFTDSLEAAAASISLARPTGANLAWAVDRMMRVARLAPSPEDAVQRLTAEAQQIQDEDELANHEIGRLGAALIQENSAVLTHCNAGALATGGYGTALGVIRSAWADGKVGRVYATETRPLLQGARLTAWELARADIPATLIADSAAGSLLHGGTVHAVVVGADRIAANGDVANKIGTYSLAVLAGENNVPFYVAAPTSTIDIGLASGDLIPIEERSGDELSRLGDQRLAPEGMDTLNLAFDVTPSRYITAIITERGVVREPFDSGLACVFEESVG